MIENLVKIWNKYSYVYINGVVGTIWLSIVTVACATVIGTFLAILKLSRFKPGQFLVDIYLEIIRGTPTLLQIYFFWLVLPKMVSFEISDTTSIIAALVFNAAAYICEIIRAGIQAVDIGQTEAALSLGLTKSHTMTKIILPQALKNILPALGNEFITMIKQTSLASIFFITELTTAYRTVQSATYLAIPALLISGIIYLVLTFVLSRCMNLLEKKMKSNER